MRMPPIVAVAAFIGALAPGMAAAANAYTTGNVNLRAGPSTDFPRVTTLPVGVSVTIHGCLSGWSWCDTSWRGYRGWVSGRYLEYIYEGRRVLVPNGRIIGLPIISFRFGSYWDRWYSDRPWYRERTRWRRNWEGRDWDDDEPRRRPQYSERYQDDENELPRRTGQGERLQGGNEQEEPRRRPFARRGTSDDVPPGISRGNRKNCPPGLEKQGRC